MIDKTDVAGAAKAMSLTTDDAMALLGELPLKELKAVAVALGYRIERTMDDDGRPMDTVYAPTGQVAFVAKLPKQEPPTP